MSLKSLNFMIVTGFKKKHMVFNFMKYIVSLFTLVYLRLFKKQIILKMEFMNILKKII